MFPIERHQQIMNILNNKKSVTVEDLSKTLFIGEATIRRDLEKLEKKNLLKRTYGGAVLLEGLDIEIPLSVREIDQKSEKNSIGYLAAQLVHDGDIIIIDSSSTALKMVPHLKGRENLTVITNGAKTILELGELSNIKIYSTGGMLRENSLSFIGQLARNSILDFYVDKVFFSCRALSVEKALTDSNEEEAELRRIMIQNSRRSVLVCDHTKFDKISFCKVVDFNKIQTIVTDKIPPSRWVDFLSNQNVELIYP